ncbi:MAG: hypothetical protein NZL93_06290, partial [Chthoniobacterales bacterium]|nr:hypothetical protein [Chthoniobacterales bacterium]
MRSTVEEGSFQYAAGRGRFVLLGCGYLGLRVYRLLTELGWKGFAVVRSEESRQSLRERGVEVIALDIGTEDFSTRLKGEFRVFFPGEEGPEVWVHCASTRGGDVGMYRCVYYGGVSGLLRAFPLAYGIFVSSTSVYHQTDGSWVEENSTTEPSQESGRVLLETEKLVVGAGGGVARLAGLYGPGRSVLLRKFIKGEARIEMTGR